MRLSQLEIETIKNSFYKVFGSGSVYLFGSRADVDKKGGDIDLYLDPDDKHDLYQKKIKFLVDVELSIGEQKIDVVFARDSQLPIEQEARKNGVKL